MSSQWYFHWLYIYFALSAKNFKFNILPLKWLEYLQPKNRRLLQSFLDYTPLSHPLKISQIINCIFVSDLVCWMQFMIISGWKFVLSQNYFCMPDIYKTNVLTQFFSTKSPFEFMFACCEFTKVTLKSKSWCEMFVLELSGIRNKLTHFWSSLYINLW